MCLAIPGQIVPMWFKAIKPGNYEVICGQLCGLGHYSMKGMLVVDNPSEYQAWLKERLELSGSQTAPAPTERPPANPSGEPGAKPGAPSPAPSPSGH